ncbi:MAG: hypothetical protein IKZ33_08555 [Lentisphaeria bacterium]|nr:hypothetical protein [Lentisphaeria bacterium]
MAVFEDKKIGFWGAAFLLLALFALTFPLWHLVDREMLGMEGELAVAVTELSSSELAPTTHGYLSDTPPLFLLLAKLFSLSGLPLLYILRGLSILSYFILTLLVFFVSRRNCGIQASCAAAAVMLSTVVVFDKLPFGSPVALTALLLYGGWILWIETTLRRSNWNLAWIIAGIFGTLIYCNAGFTGLIYFFVPLFLQRRPLTVWPKIGHPGIYYGIFMICGTAAFLLFLQAGLPKPPVDNAVAGMTFGEYLTRIAVFPFAAFARLLPWSIFLWAPFCAALIPLQDNPLFGKFHRILFLSLFILIWFNPGASSRDLFCLMPLIATMTGSYYWIIVRRYGGRICKFAACYAWGILAAAVLVALFLFLPQELICELLRHARLQDSFLQDVKQLPVQLYAVVPEIAVPAMIALCVLCFRRKLPCWLIICMLFCGSVLLQFPLRAPYHRAERERQNFASRLEHIFKVRKLEPGQDLIYTNINGLYAEGFYAGYKFRYTDTEKIPEEKQVIYLLTAKTPLNPSRSWNLVAEMEYKEQRLFIYEGQLNRSEDDYDNEI